MGGVHGVGRRYPEAPVFRKLLSRSELAKRFQSCGGPCPLLGSAEKDDGTGGSRHVLVDGGRESSVFMTGLPLELRGRWMVSTSGSGRDPVGHGSKTATVGARVVGRARVEPPRWG